MLDFDSEILSSFFEIWDGSEFNFFDYLDFEDGYSSPILDFDDDFFGSIDCLDLLSMSSSLSVRSEP